MSSEEGFDGYEGYEDGFDLGELGALPTSAKGTATVATADAGPSGQLKIHDLPDASSIMVGAAPHGAVVRIVDNPAHVGSGPVPGWVQVEFDGDGVNPPASGFASAAYLAPGGVAPGPGPSPSSPTESSSMLWWGLGLGAVALVGGVVLYKRMKKKGR